MKNLWLLSGLLLLVVSGCVWTPQAVMVKPDVQTVSDAPVQGKQILLTVVDERPRDSLGTRGVKGVGAHLTVAGDLNDVVRQSVSNGLAQRGLMVTPNKTPDGRELRVEIRNLDYEVTQGFWTGSLRANCSLKGICIIGSTRPYENLYRGQLQENVMVTQSSSANEKYINAVISQAINELLKDERLLQCLAK
jgi:uncharacterized lipoprotein